MSRTKPTLDLPCSGSPQHPTELSWQPRTQSYLLSVSQASVQAGREKYKSRLESFKRVLQRS